MSARSLVAVLLAVGCGRIDFAPVVVDAFPDIVVQPGCSAQSIAVGQDHTCVLVENGTVYCAGDNAFAELGAGTVTASEPTPIVATKLVNATSVHAGNRFTCLVDAAGGVRCLGANGDKETDGVSVVDPQLDLVTPVGLPPVTTLDTGYGFSCAHTPSDDVYCWGDTDEGEAGIGIATDNHPPESVTSLTALGTLAMSSGETHACVVLGDRSVRCWGDGSLLRLGSAVTDSCPLATEPAGNVCSRTPVVVNGIPAMSSLATGGDHTCGVTTSGDVWCWGGNDRSQAGAPPSAQVPPASVAGAANATQIVAGELHTCMRDAAGAVSCWGRNSSRQLGSIRSDSAAPVAVALPEPATRIETGPTGAHTCAMLTGGTVWCWGAASKGQLGRGPQTTPGLPGPMLLPCP